MLNEDEAVTLAVLLEELAARHHLNPLSTAAVRAAALLRRRVATARKGRGPWLGRTDPAVRREVGDTRDDAADSRDTRAGERDRRADERDARAAERVRLHHEAHHEAEAGEQHIRGLLGDGEHRGKATAAAQRRPEDREVAEAGRAGDWKDHEAVRDLLSQVHTARLAALQRRHADGQDRVASGRDRHTAQADREDAARDRQAARADRDQAVIVDEEAAPSSVDEEAAPSSTD